MNHFEEALWAANDVLIFYRKFISANFRADILLTNILVREGIIVDLRPLTDKFCGMLTIDEFETSILVNKKHISVRRFFTIGHEFGHYFMHRNQSSYFLDEKGNINGGANDDTLPLLEQQANAFASELLMPTDVIHNLLNNRFNFYRIAKTINVSYEALKWRLVRYCIQRYGLSNTVSISVVDDYIEKSKAKQHHTAKIFSLESSSFYFEKNANIRSY